MMHMLMTTERLRVLKPSRSVCLCIFIIGHNLMLASKEMCTTHEMTHMLTQCKILMICSDFAKGENLLQQMADAFRSGRGLGIEWRTLDSPGI